MVSRGMIKREPDRRLGHAAPLALTAEAKRLLHAAANRPRRSVTPLQRMDPLLFAFTEQGA